MEELSRPPLPPLHRSWSPALSATLFPALTFVALPLGALLLVEFSLLFALLFLGQAVLALAALEWVWLMFRVRQRLLLALDSFDDRAGERGPDGTAADDDDDGGEGDREDDVRIDDPVDVQDREGDLEAPRRRFAAASPTTYALRLAEAQRARSFAMAGPARWRCCCGSWVAPALALGVLAAGAGVGLAHWLSTDAFVAAHSAWTMTLAATCAAALASAWSGALAPTPGDAVVLGLYQAAVLAASMNAFLRYRAAVLDNTDLVDSLYVSLVAASAGIVFRVISSRRVLESLLLVLGDVLGLLCLAAPLVTAADAIDRSPVTDAYRQQFALFVLVVAAADAGDALARAHALPPCAAALPSCAKRPAAASGPKAARRPREVDAAAAAMGSAALALGVARGALGAGAFNAVEVAVLLLAVGVGQWARQWVVALKEVADVASTAFYLAAKSRSPGALERVALFMVALLVYYPYVKERFITDSLGGSSSGSASASTSASSADGGVGR